MDEARAQISVTVIVPVYNGAHTLPALLIALKGLQLPNFSFVEFIFVDNNSTDGSAGLIEAFEMPNSRVLFEHIQGVSAARNRALVQARGDVVALIDADCVPSRRWLRELTAGFDDARVFITAGGLASYPPKTAAQRFAARYGLNEAERNLKMGPGFANGRNMAVRRTAAEELGGWLVDMPRGEDMDFSYRVMKRFGCSIEFRPLALAFHQDRPDDESLFNQAFGYGQGLAMMYARHPDALPWGAAQRFRRARMTLRRRLSGARHRLSTPSGPPRAEAEFAIYLDKWNTAYWRGFDDAWRAVKPRRP